MNLRLDHSFVAMTDDPTDLARHAITLIEQRMRDEFGLRVRMGAEMEFSLLSPDGTKGKDGLLPLPFARGVKKHDFVPSAERASADKDVLFPNNPYVAYSYRECVYHPGERERYEMVLSHKAPFTGLAHLADVLSDAAASFTRWQPHRRSSPEHSIWTEGFAPLLKGKNVTALRVTDASESKGYTHAMHLDFSLEDIASRTNILASHHNRYSRDRLIGAIVQRNADIMHENLYLITPGVQGLKRGSYADELQEHQSLQTYDGDTEYEKDHYLENKLISADANPHYAILLQLAGIYLALSEHHFQSTDGGRFTLDRAQPSPAANISPGDNGAEPLQVRQERFALGHRLKQLLDDLEPDLGARFTNAALAHPEARLIQPSTQSADRKY